LCGCGHISLLTLDRTAQSRGIASGRADSSGGGVARYSRRCAKPRAQGRRAPEQCGVVERDGRVEVGRQAREAVEVAPFVALCRPLRQDDAYDRAEEVRVLDALERQAVPGLVVPVGGVGAEEARGAKTTSAADGASGESRTGSTSLRTLV